MDTVRLGNGVSGQDDGVIAWGRNPATGKDEMLTKVGQSSVLFDSMDVGAANQLVSFTIDRPPALNASIGWTKGADDIQVDYPAASYKIPIKFWILCADDTCSGVPAWKKADLAGFLIWADERLRAERTGIELVPADGDDWISDQTGLTGDAADVLLRFHNDKCEKLGDATRSIKREGALNVYMVRSVDGRVRNGNSCGSDDMSVVGRNALWGTILHELGHDFSLEHTDGESWYAAVGGKKNVMVKNSASRRFLTEGQVFRIHFAVQSGLNGSLASILPSTSLPNRTPRDCRNPSQTALPCPPAETVLWPDD